MMKIGLIDVDGHNFPNLALMKISAFHKVHGDVVEWVNYFEHYDKVYMSKVFTFSPDVLTCIQSDEIIKGGTGYSATIKLPSLSYEKIQPDYSLYPNFKYALGFLTRGCIRNCPWCIVPQKEGKIRPDNYIEEITGFHPKRPIILLDNNVLASDFGLNEIEKIIKLGCRVDFNQGLDARLVTDEIAKLLSKVKWIRYIRFAYDTKQQFRPLFHAIGLLNKYGIKNENIFVYCLLNELEDSYNRINEVKRAGMNPYAQPYRDFTRNQIIPQWQIDMRDWCNRKVFLKTCDFKDYSPRKGFKCSEYFIK
ncbi:hypothetical protein AGMMS49525_11970 [Bacteroidia bacterium]|nr:hypothetical protein AGMMS49525_11970 [Bacteroidia bacterium]